jgi:hypothetical protein
MSIRLNLTRAAERTVRTPASILTARCDGRATRPRQLQRQCRPSLCHCSDQFKEAIESEDRMVDVAASPSCVLFGRDSSTTAPVGDVKIGALDAMPPIFRTVSVPANLSQAPALADSIGNKCSTTADVRMAQHGHAGSAMLSPMLWKLPA